MGRDHQFPHRVGEEPARVEQAGGSVEAVGVQHHIAHEAGQKLFHQLPGLGGAGGRLGRIAKAGAHQQGGGFLPDDIGQAAGGDAALCSFHAGAQAALGQAGGHCRQHRLHAGQRDDARAGAQGSLHRQRGRAPVPRAARRHQHRAKGALVGVGGAGRDAGKNGFRR